MWSKSAGRLVQTPLALGTFSQGAPQLVLAQIWTEPWGG